MCIGAIGGTRASAAAALIWRKHPPPPNYRPPPSLHRCRIASARRPLQHLPRRHVIRRLGRRRFRTDLPPRVPYGAAGARPRRRQIGGERIIRRDRRRQQRYDRLPRALRRCCTRSAEDIELDSSLYAGAAGSIGLESKNKFEIREGIKTNVSGVLGGKSAFGDGEILSGAALSAKLRQALDDNLARVIDIFREWDEDASGTVSRREFRKALPMLGIRCKRDDADDLFDQLDDDGSEELEYSELNKHLRKRVAKDGEEEEHEVSAAALERSARRKERKARRKKRAPVIEWDTHVPGLDFRDATDKKSKPPPPGQRASASAALSAVRSISPPTSPKINSRHALEMTRSAISLARMETTLLGYAPRNPKKIINGRKPVEWPLGKVQLPRGASASLILSRKRLQDLDKLRSSIGEHFTQKPSSAPIGGTNGDGLRIAGTGNRAVKGLKTPPVGWSLNLDGTIAQPRVQGMPITAGEMRSPPKQRPSTVPRRPASVSQQPSQSGSHSTITFPTPSAGLITSNTSTGLATRPMTSQATGSSTTTSLTLLETSKSVPAMAPGASNLSSRGSSPDISQLPASLRVNLPSISSSTGAPASPVKFAPNSTTAKSPTSPSPPPAPKQILSLMIMPSSMRQW